MLLVALVRYRRALRRARRPGAVRPLLAIALVTVAAAVAIRSASSCAARSVPRPRRRSAHRRRPPRRLRRALPLAAPALAGGRADGRRAAASRASSSRSTAATASRSSRSGATRASSSPRRGARSSPTASSPARRSSAATRSATRAEFDALLAEFRRVAHASGWRLAVVGASRESLPTLRAPRHARDPDRDEAVLRPATFSLEGRSIRKVRQSVTRLTKAGYTVPRRLCGRRTPTAQRARAVSDAWRGDQAERGFSMAMDDLYAPGTLFALADDAGRAASAASCTSRRRRRAAAGRSRRCAAGRTRRTASMEFLDRRDARAGRRRPARASCRSTSARSPTSSSPERAVTVPRRVFRRALLAADRVFQLERLHSFSRKFHPDVAAALSLRREAQRPPARRARVPPASSSCYPPGRGASACHTSSALRSMAQPTTTQPRPPVGDRAGDGAARLRLLPRGAQADRPAAGASAERGSQRSTTTGRRSAASICASCSTSSGRRS